MHYQHGPISRVAGYYAREILWPNSGVGPEDVDVTGSYDAFTFTTMLQLEDYGFCKKGDGGQYVSDGTITLGGKRPNNTSGGHLCEGYTHGMNMVIENTRQRCATMSTTRAPGSAADGKRQLYLRLQGRRLPPGEGCRGQRQSRLGQPGDRIVDGHAQGLVSFVTEAASAPCVLRDAPIGAPPGCPGSFRPASTEQLALLRRSGTTVSKDA